MVTFILVVIGLLIALFGLVGCLLPIIPGPLVSFLSLVLLNLAKNWEPFSLTFMLIMAALAGLMVFLDFLVGVAGARKYGASWYGLVGSVVGMVAGIFWFPPLGIFLGAIAGAILGEIIGGQKGQAAIRAGWGVIIGNLVGISLKLAYCFTVLFFYIKEML
ncbi:MAG: DUF456 domain-containing protein [Desulfosudaceae bacterium]